MRARTFVHQWNPGVLEHRGDPKLLNKFAWQIHHLKMVEGKVLAQQQISLSKDPLKTQWATKTERMAFVSNFGRTPAILLSSANGLFPKLNLFVLFSMQFTSACQNDCFRHWHWNQRVFSMLCMSPPCFKHLYVLPSKVHQFWGMNKKKLLSTATKKPCYFTDIKKRIQEANLYFRKILSHP